MQKQLVPEELLQSSKKILFITHLAIGDFVYLQNFFKVFTQKYPHIQIDLWVDELRRTRFFWRWEGLKKYSLYDWLHKSPFFHTIYDQTYSPAAHKQSVRRAQVEEYPIVVSLAMLRPHLYANLAHKISPTGFRIGLRQRTKMHHIFRRRAYEKLQATLSSHVETTHVTQMCARWFESFFGVSVSFAQRTPFIDIPHEWLVYAKLRFLKYKIDKNSRKFGKVFFLNIFAKNKKRCWSTEKLVEFIKIMKRSDQWGDISFIVNAPPGEYNYIKSLFTTLGINDVIVLSTRENFFQLPAIMSCCDMIISVETSIMHLANAVKVPVVALMRQKNPEWHPFDKQNSLVVTTDKRSQWVRAISPQKVFDATMKFSSEKLV